MASELTKQGAKEILNAAFQKGSARIPGTTHGDLFSNNSPQESILGTKVPFSAAEFSQPSPSGSTWQSSNVGAYTVGDTGSDEQGSGPGDFDWIALAEGAGKTFPNSLFAWMAELGGTGFNPPSGTTFNIGDFGFSFQGYSVPPSSGTFYPTEELARDLMHYLLQNHIPTPNAYTFQQNTVWTIKLHDAATGLGGSAITANWLNTDATLVQGALGSYFQNNKELTLTTNSGLGSTSYTSAGGNEITHVSISIAGRKYWQLELASPLDVPAGSTVTIPNGQLNVGFAHVY